MTRAGDRLRRSRAGRYDSGRRARLALTSALLLAAVFDPNALGLQRAPAGRANAAAGDRVRIERRRTVLVRTGRLARQFPERRRAVVNLPFARSFPDPVVLRKVRALLDLKNLFDTSLAEYREDAWLEELDYKVNYNKNHVLDITIWQSGTGAYPDIHTRHLAIDLRRGEVIKAADVFKPESLETLARMADEKLRAEVREIMSDFDRRSDDTPEEREGAREALTPLRFGVEHLDEMMVSDRGVAFLFDAGFPHVIKAIQPGGEYFFTYRQLAPHIRRDGLLAQFVR